MSEEPLSMDQLRAAYKDWRILTESNGLHTAFREVGSARHVVCDYTVAGLAAKLAKAAEEDS